MMSLLLGFAILGWVLCAVSVALGLFRLAQAQEQVNELHNRYENGLKRCTQDVAKWKTKALHYEKLAVEQGLKESG